MTPTRQSLNPAESTMASVKVHQIIRFLLNSVIFPLQGKGQQRDHLFASNNIAQFGGRGEEPLRAVINNMCILQEENLISCSPACASSASHLEVGIHP